MADARAKTYTEVATLVLARNDPSALDGIPEAQLPRRSVVKAVEYLRTLDRADLADKLAAARLSPKRRGNRLPEPGEERTYAVQQGGGLDFARVPTKPLGVVRGGDVRAVFYPQGAVIEDDTGRAFHGPFAIVVPEVPDA